MKKIALSLIFIGCLTIAANAQMIIKPTIGMNLTSFSDDSEQYGMNGRVGWQFGGTVAFGSEYYLESGIIWMRNNWEVTRDVSTDNLSFDNDISCIRVPIFAGWNIVGAADDDRNFHIFGGPAVSWVYAVDSEDATRSGISTDSFNDKIWGLNIGAGLTFNKIFVDVGYEWGLSEIYKNEPQDVKSRALWVNAGLRWRF